MPAGPQPSPKPSHAESYEQHLVAPLFRPFADDLLDRAGYGPRDRLLDVACGTGIVARLARARAGHRARIVGVDANDAMLGIARSIEPAVDWRLGDAASLPVANEEAFDLVSCHQGLQFFLDKRTAAREMRRVTAAGGRVVTGTWTAVEDNPFIRDLQAVAERHLGRIADRRHSFGDADAVRDLFSDAGFGAVRLDTISHSVRIDGDTFVQLNARALVGMSGEAKTTSKEQREGLVATIASESAEAVKPYRHAAGVVFDLRCLVAIAQA